MPHSSHYLKAYRDGVGVWVTYCFKCSAESDADLAKECPGEYVSRTTAYPGTQLQGEKLPIDQPKATEQFSWVTFSDEEVTDENKITSAIGGGFMYSEKEDRMVDLSKKKLTKIGNKVRLYAFNRCGLKNKKRCKNG